MGKHIPGNPSFVAEEPAGGRRACRRIRDLHDGRKGWRHHRRVRQQRHHGSVVRRGRRALRPAQAQLARLDRQAAERLRDLAREPDQADRTGAGARGDRRRCRRDLEHRADAEGAQRAARHQIPRDRRLRSRRRPDAVDRAPRGRGHLRAVMVDHEGVAPALDQGQAAQRDRAARLAEAARAAGHAGGARHRQGPAQETCIDLDPAAAGDRPPDGRAARRAGGSARRVAPRLRRHHERPRLHRRGRETAA